MDEQGETAGAEEEAPQVEGFEQGKITNVHDSEQGLAMPVGLDVGGPAKPVDIGVKENGIT